MPWSNREAKVSVLGPPFAHSLPVEKPCDACFYQRGGCCKFIYPCNECSQFDKRKRSRFVPYDGVCDVCETYVLMNQQALYVPGYDFCVCEDCGELLKANIAKAFEQSGMESEAYFKSACSKRFKGCVLDRRRKG